MRSRWFELKPAVIALRRNGKSLSFIESNLGVPRSTLSAWCKEVELSDVQREKLRHSRLAALERARVNAASRHREEKAARLSRAEAEASETLASLSLTTAQIELALAMLYWGEGKKAQATALGCADPLMLQFLLAALKTCYGIEPNRLSCELHLRKDQDSTEAISYWSNELGIPRAKFKRVYFDRRTRETTYDTYHGVCLIYCPGIALQRKLVYLYKSFSKKIIESVGD